MVVIGSGFAGSTATLSFLEATEKAGQVGRVALIEAGTKGTWPGGSRWSRPFLRLGSYNKLMRDRAHREEQDQPDLDYWRKFEDEVPDTVEFMKDHRVKLIHHDEESAALDFEEQHFAYPGVGGGKEIIDDYLIRIAKYGTADVLYGHEATGLTLDDEGWIGGVVVQEPDGEQRTITAGSVVLACGGIAGLAEKLGLDPAKLEETVNEFNDACGPGDWNPVEMDGKGTSGITPPKSNWANPIVEAPFSGFPMTAQVKFTFGGLKVDPDGRVLNTSDAPIPGLYAAGEFTGYHKQPPQTSVLRSSTFGRIVGTNVAESLPESAAATG